jgi:hypothetical protein
MARPPAIEVNTGDRVVLNVRSLGLTDDQFFRLCSDNRDLRIEMSARGELIIMLPPGSKTGQRNAIIVYCLMTGPGQMAPGSASVLTQDSRYRMAQNERPTQLGLSMTDGTAYPKTSRKSSLRFVPTSSSNCDRPQTASRMSKRR